VVARIETAVSVLADATVYTYDADHGFNCDQRAAFDPDAAAQAWQRTIDFFTQCLA